METIESISDYNDEGMSWGGEAGYQILTDQREILMVISSGQDCCEDWGYFITEDDPEKFIGATLYSVEITDTNRSNRCFLRGYAKPVGDDREPHYLDEGDVMFVDIVTSRGTLQFVAYNGHNGYYGHTATLKSRPRVTDFTVHGEAGL